MALATASMTMGHRSEGGTSARADALLARYGGAHGPTGHASVGQSDRPVSLSAFIGGKGDAPRLGRLEGDGRTADRDAAKEEIEYRKLPGLAKEGSIASFLEQRQRELRNRGTDIEAEGKNEEASAAKVAEASDENEKALATKELKDKVPGSEIKFAQISEDAEPSKTQRKDAFMSAPLLRRDTPHDAKESDVPTFPKRSTSGKEVVVLVSGSGSNLQALIDATCGTSPVIPDAQIIRVISNRMKAYGLERAKKVDPAIPTAVHSLKTYQNRNPGKTRDDYDLVLAERVLGEHPPALVVLAGFMHIVSETFLSALGHQTSLATPPAFAKRPLRPVPIINLHPALPGAFDGANAIDRAYEAFQRGEIKHTGVMVHEVVAEVDRGAPIVVRQVPIYCGEALEALEERMHAVEHEIIVEAAHRVLSGEYTLQSDKVAAAGCNPKNGPQVTEVSRQEQRSPAAAQESGTPATQPPPKAQPSTKLDDRPIESPAVSGVTPLHIDPEGQAEPLHGPLYESDVVMLSGIAPRVWLGRMAPASWASELSPAKRAQLDSGCATEYQSRESATFMRAVGRSLVTLRGVRGASPAERQLFVVRSDSDAVYVDEMPFETQWICSAFSAVTRTPEGVRVWHGAGSDELQRARALAWACELDTRPATIEDEVDSRAFWKSFGTTVPTYAAGSHHCKRTQLPREERDALVYKTPDSKPERFTMFALQHDHVGIVDARLEIYVVIGARARGDRASICRALDRAEALSKSRTPLRLAVHVLVLPSLVPADLCALARDAVAEAPRLTCPDAKVDTSTPVWMHVCSLAAARDQLAKPDLSKEALTNENFLPVGVASYSRDAPFM